MKRPALYLAISFCLGIYLASLTRDTSYFSGKMGCVPVLSMISSVLIILSVAALKRNILSHLFLYLAILFFGAAYYQNSNILPANHIANFASEEDVKVTIKGIISDDPFMKKTFYGKEKTSFTLKAKLLIYDSMEQNIVGLVKADIYSDEEIKNIAFGDEVIMEGKLLKPKGLRNPGLFDYTEYLKIKNIYTVFSANGSDSICILTSDGRAGLNLPYHGKGYVLSLFKSLQRAAYKLRHAIRDALDRHLKTPYSGFVKAILIGERSELDNSITDDFIKTGTVHVIAISGLNIALVAGIFLFTFKIFGIRKRWNLAITSLAIILYCFVAGSTTPVVRATVIFVISCAGYLIKRDSDLLNSLSVAAFLILLTNPKELFDPSFQLSFSSVISIILFAPRIEKALGPRPSYLTKSVSISIAASAGVFPIVARYFNIISPMAIAANLIIVPAMLVITIVSFAYLILYFAGASFCIAWAAGLLSLLVQATFYINHLFAQLPFSYMRIPAPSPPFLIAYYVFLFAFFFIPRKKDLLMPLLLLVSIAVWSQNFDPARKLLRITFLDVGKGDSIVTRFPGRGAMLIDGGSGGVEGMTDMGKNVIAAYLWNKAVKKIDPVIVTHFHEDHFGGILYILDNFEIGCVMDNGSAPSEERLLYGKYLDIIKKKRIRRIMIGGRDEITGFGNSKIFVLNPDKDKRSGDPNDDSIVLMLEYKNFSLLSCGDISSSVMERLILRQELLESDIVKIPHHGGSMGDMIMAKKFFEIVSPKVCVISSGGRSMFFAAARETDSLLRSLGSDIYNTGENGAIEIISDGIGFEIEQFCRKN